MNARDSILTFDPAHFRTVLEAGFAARAGLTAPADFYAFNHVVCELLQFPFIVGSFLRRVEALDTLVTQGHLGPLHVSPPSAAGWPGEISRAVIELAAVFPLGADHGFEPIAFRSALGRVP